MHTAAVKSQVCFTFLSVLSQFPSEIQSDLHNFITFKARLPLIAVFHCQHSSPQLAAENCALRLPVNSLAAHSRNSLAEWIRNLISLIWATFELRHFWLELREFVSYFPAPLKSLDGCFVRRTKLPPKVFWPRSDAIVFQIELYMTKERDLYVDNGPSLQRERKQSTTSTTSIKMKWFKAFKSLKSGISVQNIEK